MVYQNKLVEVRDQLADATFQMDSMANEYLSTKESLKNHTSLIESIQEENKRLALMMEEYHEEKRSNDQRMEQMGTEVRDLIWPGHTRARKHKFPISRFCFQIESRMSELSEIIATKDAAIEELKSRLAKGAGGINRRTSGGGGASGGGIPETEENVALLTEALKEREDKIEHLQQQLAEAAR